MITKDVQMVTKNLGKTISKNSPTILTGLAVAGLVSTVVMAVRATPKAMQLVNEQKLKDAGHYEESDECYICESTNLPKKDVIKLTWKCYIPTAIMGTVTVACIVGANSINLKRNAALASVYSLSEAALKEYQAKVVETIGENKERAIRDDIAKDHLTKNPVEERDVIVTGNGETLCYDSFSGRYFKSDREHIRRTLNDSYRNMLSEDFVTLNEIYYGLGLDSIKLGDLLGWHVDDGPLEPAFSSQLTTDGKPCLVMDFTVDPRYGYQD